MGEEQEDCASNLWDCSKCKESKLNKKVQKSIKGEIETSMFKYFIKMCMISAIVVIVILVIVTYIMYKKGLLFGM